MNRENNTGVLPPEGEESAEFENVNATQYNGEQGVESTENLNSNTPQGNAPENLGNTAIEVRPPELNVNPIDIAPPTGTKLKKPQSVKQRETIAQQAQERATLKSAGVAKPSVAMVATLTSMRTRGDEKYTTAFTNAVAGKPLNSYRTSKKSKKARNATVTNTSVGPAGLFSRNAYTGVNTSGRFTAKKKKMGVNSSTQASSRGVTSSSQTNMRKGNIINSQVVNTTVDTILTIANSIDTQVREMKRMIKTLKTKPRAGPRVRATKKNTNTTNANNSNTLNSLLGLPALPSVPRDTDLSIIPEENNETNTENSFTPPP